MVNVARGRAPWGWSEKPALQVFTRWRTDCEPEVCLQQNQSRAFHRLAWRRRL